MGATKPIKEKEISSQPYKVFQKWKKYVLFKNDATPRFFYTFF